MMATTCTTADWRSRRMLAGFCIIMQFYIVLNIFLVFCTYDSAGIVGIPSPTSGNARFRGGDSRNILGAQVLPTRPALAGARRGRGAELLRRLACAGPGCAWPLLREAWLRSAVSIPAMHRHVQQILRTQYISGQNISQKYVFLIVSFDDSTVFGAVSSCRAQPDHTMPHRAHGRSFPECAAPAQRVHAQRHGAGAAGRCGEGLRQETTSAAPVLSVVLLVSHAKHAAAISHGHFAEYCIGML